MQWAAPFMFLKHAASCRHRHRQAPIVHLARLASLLLLREPATSHAVPSVWKTGKRFAVTLEKSFPVPLACVAQADASASLRLVAATRDKRMLRSRRRTSGRTPPPASAAAVSHGEMEARYIGGVLPLRVAEKRLRRIHAGVRRVRGPDFARPSLQRFPSQLSRGDPLLAAYPMRWSRPEFCG